MYNMKAELMMHERQTINEACFVEIVIWQLPKPLPGSTHDLKYRLAYVVDGTCVLRYDNEAGKGDHRHCGDRESRYAFSGFEQLLADFWRDVDDWRE